MDLTDTIIPRSDQLNAEDLLSGPRTVTIKEVRKSGSDEQPVDVVLVEFPPGRPFKPSKTVRRIMVAAWGPEAANYVGHRMTLYRDPLVKWGGVEIGGIRISAMSHIDKPLSIALTETRGKRGIHRVQPLPDHVPSSPAVSEATLDELLGLFARKGIPEDAQLAGVNRITGGSATDLEVITEAEARRVIANLEQRPDAGEYASAGAPYDPAAEPDGWQTEPAPAGGVA